MKLKLLFFIVFFAITSSCKLSAGPYSDDLAKCFVNSSTKEDRVALVRWIFVAASRHSAVKDISSVSEEKLEQSNKDMADLFMKLLTNSCRESAQKASQFEGEEAFASSFELLGQVAAREIWGSPEVSSNMITFIKYLKPEDLKFLKK